MEVTNIFKTTHFEICDREKALIIKNRLGREDCNSYIYQQTKSPVFLPMSL